MSRNSDCASLRRTIRSSSRRRRSVTLSHMPFDIRLAWQPLDGVVPMSGTEYASGKPEWVEEGTDVLEATNPAALANGIIGYLDPLSGGGRRSKSTADAMRVMVLAGHPDPRGTVPCLAIDRPVLLALSSRFADFAKRRALDRHHNVVRPRRSIADRSGGLCWFVALTYLRRFQE